MKKLFILLVFILTACTPKGESYTCTINNKEAVFTLKEGIVSSYTLDGENQNRSVIDEINDTYFTSSTNNEEGKEALKNYVSSLNGSCSF